MLPTSYEMRGDDRLPPHTLLASPRTAEDLRRFYERTRFQVCIETSLPDELLIVSQETYELLAWSFASLDCSAQALSKP